MTHAPFTREDVADLRAGDVVELNFRSGTSIRGPLAGKVGNVTNTSLSIEDSGWTLRHSSGDPCQHPALTGLTVISRAPRSIYTNAERAEPVVGDVVRDADEGRDTRFWMYCSDNTWFQPTGVYFVYQRDLPPKNLLLILDGATGEPPA